MNKLLVFGAAGGAAYYFWPQLSSALGLATTPAPAIAPTAVAVSTATSAQQAGATPLQQAVAAQVASTAATAAVIAAPPPPAPVSPMSPPADFQRSIVAAGYPVTATNLNWYQWDYLLNAWAGFHAPSASAMGIDPLQPLPLDQFWGAIYPTVASELPASTSASSASTNASAALARSRGVRPL